MNKLQHPTSSSLSPHQQTPPSHFIPKFAATQCIFIKVLDFTSYAHDLLTLSINPSHELQLFDYPYNHIFSAITRTSRSRPLPVWKTILFIINNHPLHHQLQVPYI